MEINNLSSMAMSLSKAETGQQILSKTLEKTAEVAQSQNRPSQAPMATGIGSKINIYA